MSDQPKMHHPATEQGPTDWAAIRLDYETTDEPVPSICRRFGVCSTSLYNRLAAEGWRHRRPDLSLASRRAGGFKDSQSAVVEGLYGVLAKQLATIEAQLANAEETGQPKPGVETSAAILRLLERLTELGKRDARASAARAKTGAGGASKQADKGSNATQDFDEDDAEPLRRELALRLARLAEAGEA